MRNRTVRLSMWCAALASLINCSSRQQIVYEFPAAMAEPIRADYTRQCEKGRVLYELSCARCHTAKARGREIIPDFKPEQLVGYQLRVLNTQHETGIPEEQVSPEELGMIMTFLTYKKKNKG